MIKGKKAILMTITALLISALFFVIFNKENILPAFYTGQPVKARVVTMDGYVQSIPVIIGDSLELATYDALDSIYIEYSKRGTFPTEAQFKTNLTNCISCGYMGGCPGIGAKCSKMNGTDLLSISNMLVSLADTHMNIDTTFLLYGVEVVQSYPYDVDVRADIGYTIYDSGFAIRWDKRENISRIVSILGLMDPLIGINTAQGMEKIITRSKICEFNDTCWDLNRTREFYSEQSFTYSVNGTSFLSRYWNSTSPSQCCGIESFMRTIDYRNISYLDHYYFSGAYTCSNSIILKYDPPLIDNEFKLDSGTAGRYGISDNGTLICRP